MFSGVWEDKEVELGRGHAVAPGNVTEGVPHAANTRSWTWETPCDWDRKSNIINAMEAGTAIFVRQGVSSKGRRRHMRFFAKARPDEVFRYRSKSRAFLRLVNARAVFMRQGRNFDVWGHWP